VPFGGPVTRRAGSRILFRRERTGARLPHDILRRHRRYTFFSPSGRWSVPTAFRAGGELVAQAMLAKVPRIITSCIAPSRAVRIECVRLDAFGDEIFSGRRIEGRRSQPAGRDMVGGDAVAEDGQDAGAADNRSERPTVVFGHIFEIRRQLDVSRVLFPLVEITFGNWHCFPSGRHLRRLRCILCDIARWRTAARTVDSPLPAAWARFRADKRACPA